MKYIIGLLLLFLTSLFASDQNVSHPIKKPNSYLSQMTRLIDKYYIDENDSKVISSQLNEKFFNWYITHCKHNKDDTINDLYVKWESIEQSCSDMNRSAQNLVANSILKEYDTAIVDMTPYLSNQQYGATGLILRHINGKIVVSGTVEQTSARISKVPYGTIITSVNRKSTDNMCLEDVLEMLRGSVGSTVTVTTDSNTSYTLVREISSAPNISHITIGNDIAIIKIRSFDNNASWDISKILEHLPPDINIVLDIRNNQGGLVDSVSDTLSLFVPPNTKLFSYISRNKNDNMDYISEDDLPKEIRKLINQNPNMAKFLTNTYKKKNYIK